MKTTSNDDATLDDLLSRARAHLESLKYSPHSLRTHANAWRQLREFVVAEGLPNRFSEELAERFLASRGVSLNGSTDRTHRGYRTSMRIIGEFAAHGCFQRRRRADPGAPLPPALDAAVETYLRYCRESLGCRASTVDGRSRTLARVCHFLGTHGVASLSEMRPEHILAFLRSRAHYAADTLASVTRIIRGFLRAAFTLGIVTQDISCHIRYARIPPDARIPEVWSEADLTLLFSVVDRGSPMGKRDYAILLLASRLGMRVGDIRSLTLENFHWADGRISRAQCKTGRPLDLPLDDTIAAGIIDYLRHGRPATSSRHLFLRLHAPHEPLDGSSVGSILKRHRQRAGIRVAARSRRGMHSLRHTIATRLIADGAPLETIAAVLGHSCLDSTRIYTKIDIQALRSAALDPDQEGQS